MLDKVFLPVEYTVAAVNNTRPVFSSLVHPHLMFFPVGLRLKCLQYLALCTVRAEYARLVSKAIHPFALRCGGRRDADIIRRCVTRISLDVERTTNVRDGS